MPADVSPSTKPPSPSLNEAGASTRIEGKEPAPFKHVFQTIFLDRDGSRELWSIGEIKEEEIILEKWWKQQSHRWQHCASSSLSFFPCGLLTTEWTQMAPPYPSCSRSTGATERTSQELGQSSVRSSLVYVSDLLLIPANLAIADMHEIGIVSGFAAAYQLGARYPFTDDKECKRLFALYLAASHGSRMVSFALLASSLSCC